MVAQILFIGGTGNISAECAAALHERGHQILVLSRGRNEVPSAYHALQADRKDPTAMRQALKGVRPEVVINFLGYELSDVQLDFELFKKTVRQYLFISSTTVYARPAHRLPLTEDAALGNVWWEYAQKKLACEQWLRGRYTDAGFPVTIVRPSHNGTLKGDKAHPGLFDNAKIKRFAPDYQCRKPFHDGVRESIAWLRAHPARQNLNPQVDRQIEEVLAAWRPASG